MDKKVKKVSISEELFIDIFKYFNLDEPEKELHERIKFQLQEKITSIKKRELYTKSKTGASLEEREEARKQYLDLVGMHEDFRY